MRPVHEKDTSFLIFHAYNAMGEWCFTRGKTRVFDMGDDILNDIEISYCDNRVRTHWDGCAATHIDCAVAYLVKRVRSAEARVGKLEIEIDRLQTSVRNTVLQMSAKTEVTPQEWLDWGRLVLGEDLSNGTPSCPRQNHLLDIRR